MLMYRVPLYIREYIYFFPIYMHERNPYAEGRLHTVLSFYLLISQNMEPTITNVMHNDSRKSETAGFCCDIDA